MFLEAGMSIGVVGLTCMAAFAATALAAAVRSFRAGWEFAWLALVYLIHLVDGGQERKYLRHRSSSG
jgi:apolipoprotein N-acyltransferase